MATFGWKDISPRRCIVASIFFTLATLFISAPTSAQTLPTAVYHGIVGKMSVEVILQHDSAWNGMGGFLEGSEYADHLTLEKTPYNEKEPLLINVIDGSKLPSAAIELLPFTLNQQVLHGRWIDLRTRDEMTVRLERQNVFSDRTDSFYKGDLLQKGTTGGMNFRVHARKAPSEYPGTFDRITVFKKETGKAVQTIEGLDAYFSGTDTLTLAYLNSDHILDFSFVPRRIRQSDKAQANGITKYYVFNQTSGQYELHSQLNEMSASGYLYFISGQRGRFKFRPENSDGFRPGQYKSGYYRFIDSEQIAPEQAGESAN